MHIYTDGSSRGNPGPGGWGIVALFDNGTAEERSGSKAYTTNNEMELEAVIQSIRLVQATLEIDPSSEATIYSDSTYVVNGASSWLSGWKKKGWRTASKEPVKNQPLWETIDEFLTLYKGRIHFKKVAGHSGHVHNERADELATAAADSVIDK